LTYQCESFIFEFSLLKLPLLPATIELHNNWIIE